MAVAMTINQPPLTGILKKFSELSIRNTTFRSSVLLNMCQPSHRQATFGVLSGPKALETGRMNECLVSPVKPTTF